MKGQTDVESKIVIENLINTEYNIDQTHISKLANSKKDRHSKSKTSNRCPLSKLILMIKHKM